MKSKLSKDYEYLYDEVCKGNEAFCKIKEAPYDDSLVYPCVCMLRDGLIVFISKGRRFGLFHIPCSRRQKTHFLQECIRLDVEFVVIDK
tara:strand:+ start:714 stop:980 length:267 start_codon:yes stop_codon:yes gene_type:complete